MNDNWPIAKIGDCASLVRHTLGPDACNGEKYIGLEHIGEGSLTITSTGDGTLVQSAKSKFQAGDALFGKLRPYFRKVAIAPFDGVCSTDIWVIRAKTGTDQRFLFYRLASQEFIDAATRGSEGTKMPRAKWEFVSRFAFPLPPLPIQKRIAHILGTLDDKIELNRRMNETLEAMARAIFKSWFIDFDPVKRNMERNQPSPGLRSPSPTGRGAGGEGADALFPSEFQNSDLGLIPKGWGVSRLSEILSINPPRRLVRGTVAPYLEMANLPSYAPAPEGWVMREVRSGMKFINGDTLVARITPCLENGKTAYVNFLTDGQTGWGSTEFIVLRPREPIPPIFAYLLARTEEFRTFAIQQMTGSSGRQRVPVASLENFRIVAPSYGSPIFRTFGSFASPAFNRITATVVESRRLAALRDVLLPTLLSGELQVKITEAPGK